MHSHAKIALLCMALAGSLVATAPARAEYPEKPIYFIITNAAGGGSDIYGRVLAKELSVVAKQPVIVENRTGAGSTIGTRYVSTSPPDGYRLLFITNTVTIDQNLKKSPDFDVRRDLTPISSIAKVPVAVMVHPDVPATTLPEFIAYMKANPGVVNYATTGVGSTTHLMWEYFAARTGTRLVHIPYQGGGQMTTAVIGKTVHAMWNEISSTLPRVKAGQLRMLATSGTRDRYPLTPDVPTFHELGYTGFEFGPKFGVYAPAGTPDDLAKAINALVVKAMHTPAMEEDAKRRGFVIETSTVDEFKKEVADEVQLWGKIVKDAKIELQ